jgi:hypothetical protein
MEKKEKEINLDDPVMLLKEVFKFLYSSFVLNQILFSAFYDILKYIKISEPKEYINKWVAGQDPEKEVRELLDIKAGTELGLTVIDPIKTEVIPINDPVLSFEMIWVKLISLKVPNYMVMLRFSMRHIINQTQEEKILEKWR